MRQLYVVTTATAHIVFKINTLQGIFQLRAGASTRSINGRIVPELCWKGPREKSIYRGTICLLHELNLQAMKGPLNSTASVLHL